MATVEWDALNSEDVEGLPVYDVQGREVGSAVHWEQRPGDDTARFDVAVPGLPSPVRLDVGSGDVQFQGDGVHLSRSLDDLASTGDIPVDNAVEDRLSETTPRGGEDTPP